MSTTNKREFFVLRVLLACLIMFVTPVSAEETPKGGQVSTKSTVTFYQKKGSEQPPNKSGEKPSNDKIKNHLPQTGEVIRPLGLVVGLGLVTFVLAFIWKRRNKEEASNE